MSPASERSCPPASSSLPVPSSSSPVPVTSSVPEPSVLPVTGNHYSLILWVPVELIGGQYYFSNVIACAYLKLTSRPYKS
jgi:hypothetical protein